MVILESGSSQSLWNLLLRSLEAGDIGTVVLISDSGLAAQEVACGASGN